MSNIFWFGKPLLSPPRSLPSPQQTPSQKIIQKYAGKSLLNYAKVNKKKIYIVHGLLVSYRNTPFIELLYPYGSDYIVYNSSFVQNQANTMLSSYLNITDEPFHRVDQKQLMYDLNIYCKYTQSEISNPIQKKYNFINNDKIGVVFDYLGVLQINAQDYYQENFVFRNNTYLYYPMTFIYLLISQNPYKIYIMQSLYLNNTKVTSSNSLFLLSNDLVLPEGWTYCYLQLHNLTYLTVPSNGKALVISDNLSNGYMCIPEKAAPWLYAKYK